VFLRIKRKGFVDDDVGEDSKEQKKKKTITGLKEYNMKSQNLLLGPAARVKFEQKHSKTHEASSLEVQNRSLSIMA
jgi:hypothetical protein